MKKFVLSLVASSALAAFSTSALADRQTRDLVFEDDEPVAKAQSSKESIAVKTTVILKRDGKETTVVPSTEFKSGDKVKLAFTANTDGYVYWLAKGTTGSYDVIFPNPKVDASNEIKRNEEKIIPSKGAFKFDDNPGNEELLCIVSKTKLPDIEELIAENNIDKMKEDSESGRQTRDLVFEDEDENDVNTVSQEVVDGEPFIQPYTLRHN